MRATTLMRFTCAGAVLLAGLAIAASGSAIPARLADYHSWKPLTSAPRPIPWQLAQLCAAVLPGPPPTPSSSDTATHGPHADRWVRVFANDAAANALDDATVRAFPTGAMIAKEKLVTAGAEHPEGVAFMVKHRAGEFSASGGWEFLYYPSAGKLADYSGCIDCHRTRGRKDYVFGTYGRSTTP